MRESLDPRRLARAAAALGLGGLLALLPGTPAHAHPAGIQAAVDYQTTVMAVTPGADGLRVRFVADGSQLELRTDGRPTVEVLGYDGEPMFRVGPDGAWRNERSPSVYVDIPGGAARAGASPRAEPRWQRLTDRPVVRWPDHRSVWHGSPPPPVLADPGRVHRVLDWHVRIRVDGQPATIDGFVEWLPRPRADAWWLAMIVLVAALTAMGVAARRRPARGRWVLAGTALAVGAGTIAYQMLVVTANAEAAPGAFALALLSRGLHLLLGAALLGGAAATLAGRDFGLFLVAVGGPLTAFVAGLPNVALFHHAVAPVTVNPVWARLIEVVVLGGGTGVLAFILARSRRPGPSPSP